MRTAWLVTTSFVVFTFVAYLGSILRLRRSKPRVLPPTLRKPILTSLVLS
jgi:hypothetical protein